MQTYCVSHENLHRTLLQTDVTDKVCTFNTEVGTDEKNG